jgi:hypothetical protein
MLQRSWVHGDENDNSPGTYYCAFCDAFYGMEHFTHANAVRAGPGLYRKSMKLNRQRLKSGGWYRSEGHSELQVPWAVEMRLTEKPRRRRRS